MIRLEEHWYRNSLLALLLWPLSVLFCLLASLRRLAYRRGLRQVTHPGVPVIVVGNLTVGGTGKTPLVIWLVERLRDAGYRPGIVSRGYRGRAADWPQAVHEDSDPRLVGDEPLLLARRCQCPLYVGPERVAAARALLAAHDCNVLLCDDGLQHYALGRDIEIAVIDGVRRFGNGFCLPAGPLREPRRRLDSVDIVVNNGGSRQHKREYAMQLQEVTLRNVRDPAQMLALDAFRGQRVHALAGIGHPQRFFTQLERLGMVVDAHPLDDHHDFCAADLEFADTLPVVMTEKDAVKCSGFAGGQCWYLQVSAVLDEGLEQKLLELLAQP